MLLSQESDRLTTDTASCDLVLVLTKASQQFQKKKKKSIKYDLHH